MPRGRMLNKKISYSEKVAELSLEAKLLFTWCIPHLDVEGRIYGSPTVLKGMVVPLVNELTPQKIENCLEEMTTHELIVIYGDKQKYIQFIGFQAEQNINKDREAKSEIPTPENSRVTPENSRVTPEYSRELTAKLSKDKLSKVNILSPSTEGNHLPFKEIIDFLNTMTGKRFNYLTKATQRHISARIKEGHSLADFKAVIEKKCNQWLGDPKMNEYLRPETLFGTKFEGYLNTEVKDWREG